MPGVVAVLASIDAERRAAATRGTKCDAVTLTSVRHRVDLTRPASLRPTVAEVLKRAAAKEIGRARMLRELQDLRVAYVNPEEFPDSDWALLRRAVQGGVLTRTDVRKVAEDTARRFVARVTASMDLEDQTVQEPAVAQMLQEATDRMVSSLV